MGIAEKVSRKLFDLMYNPAIKVYEAKLAKEGLNATFRGYTITPGVKMPFAIGQTDDEVELLNEGSLEGIMLVNKYKGLTRGKISVEEVRIAASPIAEDALPLARFFISQGLRGLAHDSLSQKQRDEMSKNPSLLKPIYERCMLYHGKRLFERQDTLAYSGKLFVPNIKTESGWEEVGDSSFVLHSKDISFLSRVPLS